MRYQSSFACRSWGTAVTPHPVDTRTCSVSLDCMSFRVRFRGREIRGDCHGLQGAEIHEALQPEVLYTLGVVRLQG